jgi:hypothetical protein
VAHEDTVFLRGLLATATSLRPPLLSLVFVPHRLQELQLVQQAEAAVVRYARDGSAPVKLAAAAAVADLVTRQLSSDSSSSNSSLEALVAPLVGLLGLDQPSEVQRGGMQVVEAAAVGGGRGRGRVRGRLVVVVVVCQTNCWRIVTSSCWLQAAR